MTYTCTDTYHNSLDSYTAKRWTMATIRICMYYSYEVHVILYVATYNRLYLSRDMHFIIIGSRDGEWLSLGVLVPEYHLSNNRWLIRCMLLLEARRCGGTVQQMYDTVFHQQVANTLLADWSRLNSLLYPVKLLTIKMYWARHASIAGKRVTCLQSMHWPKWNWTRNQTRTPLRTTPNQTGTDQIEESIGDTAARYLFPGMTGDGLLHTMSIVIHVFVKSSGEHKVVHCTARDGYG